MKKFAGGIVVGVALTLGMLGTLWHVEAKPSSGLWADACVYRVDDASLQYGWPYGTLKYVGAFVGNYDGSPVFDFQAKNAVGSFECERVY